MDSSVTAERFCDNDGEYKRRYNVYKLTANGKACVLKKSDSQETAIYRDFFQGRGFAVPEYFGSVECDGAVWMLMEYIEGPDLRRFDPEMPELPAEVTEQVEISIKYEGYIQRQLQEVEELRRMESRSLPDGMDYMSIQGLRLEAREKLNAVHPMNLGQAARISGVSPADVAALMIYLEK